MLASSLDAVVTVDASGRVLTFNRAAEEVFGYAADEALGRDIAELIIPPSLRERHYSALTRHVETGSRTIIDRRVERGREHGLEERRELLAVMGL